MLLPFSRATEEGSNIDSERNFFTLYIVMRAVGDEDIMIMGYWFRAFLAPDFSMAEFGSLKEVPFDDVDPELAGLTGSFSFLSFSRYTCRIAEKF